MIERTAFRSIILLCACAAAGAGCDGGPRELHGYGLDVPAGWTRWEGALPLVPGEILEAYRVPAAGMPGSLVVFRSPFNPSTTAEQLLVQRRSLVVSLPSLRIHSASVVPAGGRDAVLLDLTAEGTGKSLSPTGLGKPLPPAGESQAPTRRVWLIFPRGPENGTLEILWHCPEADQAAHRAALEAVLRSVQVR